MAGKKPAASQYQRVSRLTPHSQQNLAESGNLKPHSWQNLDIFSLAELTSFVLCGPVVLLWWLLAEEYLRFRLRWPYREEGTKTTRSHDIYTELGLSAFGSVCLVVVNFGLEKSLYF